MSTATAIAPEGPAVDHGPAAAVIAAAVPVELGQDAAGAGKTLPPAPIVAATPASIPAPVHAAVSSGRRFAASTLVDRSLATGVPEQERPAMAAALPIDAEPVVPAASAPASEPPVPITVVAGPESAPIVPDAAIITPVSVGWDRADDAGAPTGEQLDVQIVLPTGNIPTRTPDAGRPLAVTLDAPASAGGPTSGPAAVSGDTGPGATTTAAAATDTAMGALGSLPSAPVETGQAPAAVAATRLQGAADTASASGPHVPRHRSGATAESSRRREPDPADPSPYTDAAPGGSATVLPAMAVPPSIDPSTVFAAAPLIAPPPFATDTASSSGPPSVAPAARLAADTPRPAPFGGAAAGPSADREPDVAASPVPVPASARYGSPTMVPATPAVPSTIDEAESRPIAIASIPQVSVPIGLASPAMPQEPSVGPALRVEGVSTPLSTAPTPTPEVFNLRPGPAISDREIASAPASPAALPAAIAATPDASLASGAAGRVFAAALHAASGPVAPAANEAVPQPIDAPDPVVAALLASAAPMPATSAVPNAAATAIDLHHAAWPTQMAERIEALRDGADATSTRIRISPDALGPVDLQVRRDGDRLHVHFAAANPETRALIADAQPQLAAAAADRGLKLGQTSVGADGASNQPGNDQPTRQPATPARPARPTNATAAATDDGADPDIRLA